MNNADKIKMYKNLYANQLNRSCNFHESLEKMGDIKCDYVEYMTTHPVDCDRELERLPQADYDICCALLTMLLREDYFCNGSFTTRCRKGQVSLILERMMELLAGDE